MAAGSERFNARTHAYPLPPWAFAALVAGSLLGAALPVAGQLDTDLTVLNTPPVVLSVGLEGLVAPFSVTPNAGTTKPTSILIVVEDLNGCNDITSVAVTIKSPSDATLVNSAAATYSSCTALTSASYSYTYTVNFYDDPGSYKIEVVATDSKGATGSNLLDITSFTVEELVAVNLATSSISFGIGLDPSDTSPAQSVALQNHGNVVIDSQFSGTAMSRTGGGGTIAVGNIQWSLASDMTGSQSLGEVSVTSTDFNLAKGASSSKAVYWTVTIPDATPAGTYTGTLTIGAIKST